MEDTLFPPRDKSARRLWDTMNKFKKGGGRKLGRELLLPAESGYLRACAHNFAERLGLMHLSMGEGQARRVLLQLPDRARGAGNGGSSSAVDGAADPDEPAAKRKRPSGQPSASAADDDGLQQEEGSAAAAAAVSKKAAPPPRKPFMARLTECMKQDDPHEALRVFDDMAAQGLLPDGHMCSMLLKLFGNASPPMQPESERVFAATQRAGVVPDEPSWSGMVRLFSLHGDLAQATAALDTMSELKIRTKLRSVSPLLVAACERGDLDLATRCTERLHAAGLTPSAAEFVPLVRLHAGLLERSGGSDDAAAEARLDALLRWVAEENPPLCNAQLAQLHACFDARAAAAHAAHAAAAAAAAAPAPAAAAGGVPAAAPAPVAAIAAPAPAPTPAPAPAAVPGRWRAERCSVGAEGTCSGTQLPMRAIEISAEARANLRANIPRLAGSKARGEEFSNFGAWVDEQGPFEFVLDGANIGFFGQGKAAKTDKVAAFSYEQVDAVLRSVCARSERVLLVLHVSHTDPTALGPASLKLVQGWRERGILFSSPTKHNDDWYWLYAAMASGESCKVVSNDEMRDHHFGMLSPRSFLRWKERHVVHFSFCKKKKNVEPELEYPPSYSIAIQDHPGRSWLFPCSEAASGGQGGSREWLLVRPAEAKPEEVEDVAVFEEAAAIS